MDIPGTHLHIAIAIIIIVEIIIFYNQLLSYFARPTEHKRVWHLIMFAGLIITNFVEGTFQEPYPNLSLPEMFQNYLGFGFGYILAAYFPLYCYKTLQLKELRLHGSIGFCVVFFSMVTFWGIIYPIKGDVIWIRQNVFYVPAVYCGFLIFFIGAIIYRNRILLKSEKRFTDTVLIYGSLVPWISAPLLGAFAGQPQWIIDIFLNIGFLIFNMFVSIQTIKNSKLEQNKLKELNENLNQLVVERTEQLQNTMDRLQVSYTQRENAFVNLIHETKTPITLINNYLEEHIEKNGGSEDLAIVKKNINKLSKDINNLFDLERFNKGLDVHNGNQVANLSEILEEAIHLFEKYCSRKEISLTSKIATEIYLTADPDAIVRIINNIIENAIKFSDTGSKIELTLTANSTSALFECTDEGMGIEPNQLENIFTPYFQINTTKKNIQGMGLGLPLVRNIVHSLQGQISLISPSSKMQKGTTVLITLPRCPELPTESVSPFNNGIMYHDKEPDITDYFKHEEGATILVVEDNLHQNAFLSRKLSEQYNIVTAINGKQALEKIQQSIPDLIISDIMMDEMDGFKLAEILSGDAVLCHIPIIFLSARNSDKDKLKGLTSGAIDYIEKPFSTDQVKLKISAILNQREKQESRFLHDLYTTMKHYRKNGMVVPEVTDKNATLSRNVKLFALTRREADVATLLMEGNSAKAIGEKFFISEKTVNTHIRNLYEKMGVKSKFEMMTKLQRSG